MRKTGYKQVQVWVKDRDGEEFGRYLRKLEKRSEEAQDRPGWACERMVLEIHLRNWKAMGVIEGMLREADENGQPAVSSGPALLKKDSRPSSLYAG